LGTPGALPVVDEHGEYAGVVGLDALGAGALEDELGSATAGSLASFAEAPHSDDPLRRAMALFAHPDGARGLPVIDTSGSPIGWLSHPDVVRHLIGSPQSAEP
jgi:CBS-domain-containing membrane protein